MSKCWTVDSLESGSVIEGDRRNLFPVNGGLGSMLATKFGNEEAGGRFGKGFCRLAAALAPPGSTTLNANGGFRASNKAFPAKLMRFAEMPYPPRRTKSFEENGCHAKPMRGSGWHLNGTIQER